MARSYDLTSGSIPQHLLRLAAPLIMGNILQQLYNTVDAFILGRFAGELEFAAVGVAGSVMNLFLFMITGACTGISVIFAQLYGAGERERFRREHWLSLSCGLLVTLACSGLGFLLLSPLLQFIQTPSELKTFVSVYLTIILASLPAEFLYNLYGALLRAIGRANAALMAFAAAVTVNVALDYCFVARFQLGIAGAAWATAASQAISAVLCILYLRRKAPELIFARAYCRMDGELSKQTAHFSFVTALHQSSLYIGKLLVQGAVNTGGTDMISAYTATTRIEGFANSFGDSGSAATSVLVAQNRGAGKEERVKEPFRSSLFLMLAMSLIMYVSASTSVGFMLGTRSGAAFENARDYLKLVALFYTLCFTGNTFAGYFNGIGKVSVPFHGATSHIALRVVLSWLLVGKMGPPPSRWQQASAGCWSTRCGPLSNGGWRKSRKQQNVILCKHQKPRALRRAAFDKFCEVSPLIEMRGKGMTFLRKHEVFAHMGRPCRKRKTFVRDALCLLNFCKVKLVYNSSKW